MEQNKGLADILSGVGEMMAQNPQMMQQLQRMMGGAAVPRMEAPLYKGNGQEQMQAPVDRRQAPNYQNAMGSMQDLLYRGGPQQTENMPYTPPPPGAPSPYYQNMPFMTPPILPPQDQMRREFEMPRGRRDPVATVTPQELRRLMQQRSQQGPRGVLGD
jgi:hypothetical protein